MEQKDFEALEDMFMSPGWALYQKSIESLKDTLINAAPDGAVTNDQWQFARGQIRQLRSDLGYENMINITWEQMNEVQPEERHVDVNAI